MVQHVKTNHKGEVGVAVGPASSSTQPAPGLVAPAPGVVAPTPAVVTSAPDPPAAPSMKPVKHVTKAKVGDEIFYLIFGHVD